MDMTFENVWLLIDACDAIGVSNYPLVDLYGKLWECTRKYGYDQEKGGVFYTGGFNEPAKNRNKEWWVEAEALVSALQMYRLTKEPDTTTLSITDLSGPAGRTLEMPDPLYQLLR